MSQEVEPTKEQFDRGASATPSPSPTSSAALAREAFADRVSEWSRLASRSGFTDFVSPEDGFKTCLESRSAWANKDRPGIYFWLSTDGEAYIG